MIYFIHVLYILKYVFQVIFVIIMVIINAPFSA